MRYVMRYRYHRLGWVTMTYMCEWVVNNIINSPIHYDTWIYVNTHNRDAIDYITKE